MKIAAFLLCWNESKIIRHTLNHYSQFCDEITVLDNESTDNTLDIIKKEYPQVKIKTFLTYGQFRDDVHQYLKNTCWKKSAADWVIVADMDELLYHPSIKYYLQEQLTKNIKFPRVDGFNMFSDTFCGDYSKPITDQVKRGIRNKNFDKQIIFNPKGVNSMGYTPGAHSFEPEVKIDMTAEFKRGWDPVYLLHYKYLGEQYLVDKHKQYADRLSLFNKQNNHGCEYLRADDHVKEAFNLIRTSDKLFKVIR